MSPKVLVIIPCGRSKIWRKFPESGATRAEEAYIGSPFKVNRAFAEKFADKWMILSAKYGFIEPSFVIPENYDVSFNDSTTNPMGITELRIQAKQKVLESYDVVIALGGKDYIEIVKEVFQGSVKVFAPAECMRVGDAMGFIKTLTNLDKVQMLKRIS